MRSIFQNIKNKKSSLNFRRRRRKFNRGRFKNCIIISLESAAVILSAYLLVTAFGRVTNSYGQSMDPTIHSGDRLLLDRISYRVSSPKRGDIVSFHPAGNLNSEIMIKRIVGVPGDKLEIRSGTLYVNGSISDAVSHVDAMDQDGLLSSPMKLRKGEYFVLGDNRNNSEDSRFETIGNITKNEIIGKIWFNITSGNFGLMQ